MKVSFSADLDDGRAITAIGRVRATTRWRAAAEPGTEDERRAAIGSLVREAAEYDADAIVDVRFEVDDVKGVDIEGVALQRVTVTGLAVRFARAAAA
ncbi:putative heavy-metal-binding protein [Roseiarcus fermentans]|uniref:Putative heavy-metal-binding protein n=1 Tax=Roseiarcus fermentans TaxID=1473586 RepID=A0A366FWF5_9HYPH|nr:heavy metal-binding domain-containing protein [Roseiarcus fermentans]RBP18075.1 putative heavy-metal-binding protein [Roseiarcus fermentans]